MSNLQTVSSTTYRFTASPISPGTVSGFIIANAAFDAAGNGNVQGPTRSVTYQP